MSGAVGELLERVRKATGPDRVLDLLIDVGVRGLHLVGNYEAEDRNGNRVKLASVTPEYTASIDAALGLVERMLPEHDWILGHTNGGLTVHCQLGPDESKLAFGETPPLAILAALLSALAAKEGEESS